MIPYLSLQQMTALHVEEIEHAVTTVLHRGWYLLGQEVAAFEKEYASFIGTSRCVTCANGLDALRLIFMAYRELGLLHDGDEVIVPANTYIATILAISDNRLKPVLVEPSVNTLQIDDTLIGQYITPRTKAIMIVHLYGRCAYTDRIGELCKRHNLLLLEDNAQGHGCMASNGRRTGALGNAAAHSFYPGKNLGALGDAGAVTTDDPEVAETIKILANYGSQCKYMFKYQGLNSRMDEIQAAVLRVKLHYLEQDNGLRRVMAQYYMDNIRNSIVTLPYGGTVSADNVFHIFPIMCGEREELQQWLDGKGIQTLIHYPIPPHKQECYRHWNALSYPITERIAKEELSLPIAPYMTKEYTETIVDAINEFRL